jgi:DNA modification methylase
VRVVSVRLIHGDCREVLKTLADASVHCVVTSPPYFGLRDYGTARWEGGDSGCDHGATRRERRNAGRQSGVDGGVPGSERDPIRTFCQCGAVRTDAQMGSEPSLASYIAGMVDLFREVRRVLRDDGTLWLNMGDGYCSTAPGTMGDALHQRGILAGVSDRRAEGSRKFRPETPTGLKPKDLMMVPARLAIALQDDGWWLRSDIIWAKKNCMPESVRDRPTTAHEHIFLLTKRPSYFYDATAIEEAGDIPAGTRAAKGSVERAQQANGRPPEYAIYTGRRNKRSVWHVATQPFAEAHFATMPPAIVEPCILAGTSERGCCAVCGAPWDRVVDKTRTFESGSGRAGNLPTGKNGESLQGGGATLDIRRGPVVHTVTTGWRPTCACNTGERRPCTVLDPFFGAGTVGLVADRLGRDCIGIELNPEYAAMAQRRLHTDAGMFAQVTP